MGINYLSEACLSPHGQAVDGRTLKVELSTSAGAGAGRSGGGFRSSGTNRW